MDERSSDQELLDELASVHAELRQVKAALHAREGDGHVRAILDALPESLKIYDEHRRLVYINPCGLQLHQAQNIEEMWRPGTATVAPEYLDEALEIHRRVIAGETVVGTCEIVGTEGRRVHVESQAVPFLLPDGRRGHMCLSRDVTDRLKAEQVLRESEERLRLVQEATALAEFEAGPEGITSFTHRFLEQTGLPPGTAFVSHEDWLELVHPDDRDLFQQEVARCIQSTYSVDFEFRIVRRDTGEVRWISSRTRLKRDGSAGYIIGAHLDVTERRRAEEALRESEERFRLAAEAAGLGVWDYDALLDEREWSDRLLEIFGLCADAPAQFEVALQCIHPENRSQFKSYIKEIRAGKSHRSNATFRIMRVDDGRERWISVNAWRTHKADKKYRRIIMTVRDITEEKTAEQRVRWSATHDALTGLVNRAQFREDLEVAVSAARQHGHSVGIVLLDLDHFKQVNDALGHYVGDALLKMFADRLRIIAGPELIPARLGGDEFAIVVPELLSELELAQLCRAIQERTREPFVHEGRILDCRVSAGAAMFPKHSASTEDLLKNADMALYAAKAGARATVSIFEPRMREDFQKRISMVRLARCAIGEDRIIPYYQPKLELATAALEGFEALLRWRTPDGRIDRPAALEAAFEDFEVAAAISDRMIERTISDMRLWLDRGIDFRHVAVNASAAEFRRDDFAERVLERLGRAEIPTCCFQIEVTEIVFLGRGAEYVHRALALLSAEGVKIALDDFGTGYASLRHLKQFPVDIIKIDQSFVRDMAVDPGDEAIVRAIINLGSSLGIGVVAEGIETQLQLDRLSRLGCDMGQGFLFSPSVSARRVPALIGRLSEARVEGQTAYQGGKLRLVAN